MNLLWGCCILLVLMLPLNDSVQVRLHEGFVQLGQLNIMKSDHFLAHHEYSLEFVSENTKKEDFLAYGCFLNNYQFLDSFGCLRPNAFVLSKFETNKYYESKPMKQLLVHFIAPSDDVMITCKLSIIKCNGCVQNFCENKTDLRVYQSTLSTILCNRKSNIAVCEFANDTSEPPNIFSDRAFRQSTKDQKAHKEAVLPLESDVESAVKSIMQDTSIILQTISLLMFLLLFCFAFGYIRAKFRQMRDEKNQKNNAELKVGGDIEMAIPSPETHGKVAQPQTREKPENEKTFSEHQYSPEEMQKLQNEINKIMCAEGEQESISSLKTASNNHLENEKQKEVLHTHGAKRGSTDYTTFFDVKLSDSDSD